MPQWFEVCWNASYECQFFNLLAVFALLLDRGPGCMEFFSHCGLSSELNSRLPIVSRLIFVRVYGCILGGQ